jgi:predicted lipoprotein with Yx(FWY)xxD motif
MRQIRKSPALVVILLCVLLGGCGTATVTPKAYSVHAIKLPGAGRVLADGSGYSLYVYLPDEQGQSRCTLACAATWPPLLLPSGVRRPTAGPGIDPALLGTTRRDNGSLQVTYNGWPLYTYLDDGPGQATGQGEGMGAWYLISTTGVRRPAARHQQQPVIRPATA